MSFSQSLVSSAALAGATFCAASVPLMLLNSEAVTVQVNDEPVFVGQFQDAAGPYIAITMAISLGIGAVHFSTLGWRDSSSQLTTAEGEITDLKQQLKEQVARVDAIQFSDSKLEKAGLNKFIDAEKKSASPAQMAPAQAAPAQVAPAAAVPMVPAQMAPVQMSAPAHVAPQPAKQLSAAAAMPAAQAFRSYSTPVQTVPAAPKQAVAAQPMDDLMSQLKHVMEQVERLQGQGINASANLA